MCKHFKFVGSLNCAAFIAGIMEATLVCCNFVSFYYGIFSAFL